MFENLYGLSCVENQVLAFLLEAGMDIRPLYYDAALPMKELFFFLVLRGEPPERFERLPRIQNTLKELEILDMTLERRGEVSEALERAAGCGANQMVLIRLKLGYSSRVLRARGWREDHFARLRWADGMFWVDNDIPEVSAVLLRKAAQEAYDGEYFLVSLRRALTASDARRLWRRRRFRPELHVPFHFEPDDLRGLPDMGERLRNMTGIYKTLRRRMAAYYGQYTDTDFLTKLAAEAEKTYARLEYCRLKYVTDTAPYFALLRELNIRDNEAMERLKTQLEMKKHGN